MKQLILLTSLCLSIPYIHAHPIIRTGVAHVARAGILPHSSSPVHQLQHAVKNSYSDSDIKRLLPLIATTTPDDQLYKDIQLLLAVKNLNTSEVEKWLARGANPNATFEGNRLPCLYAAVDTVPPYEYPYQSNTSQAQEVIQLLIDHGANPYTTAARNQSVVEYATAQDNSSAVACLLQTQPPALTKTSAIAALYHIACRNDETVNGQRIFALIAAFINQ